MHNEKDYKYEKADGLLKKLSANNLDEAINLVYKLEEKIEEYLANHLNHFIKSSTKNIMKIMRSF